MPLTITSKAMDATGRTLVTFSDGTQFYVADVAVLSTGPRIALTSPPANLTAGETVLTFASTVSRVNVQNNSPTDKWMTLDGGTASEGVLIRVPSGILYSEDVQCSVVHIWSSSADALNTSAVGVAVWGNA